MASETPVLELPNVCVTNTKVTLFGTTYFLQNITSVKVVEHSDVHSFGLVLGVAGMLAAVIALTQLHLPTIIGGLVAVGVGWLMWKYGTKYEVILTTGATEQHGLTTPVKAIAVRIQAAINIAVENRMALR